MEILVTGATGMLGAALVPRLRAGGHHVRAMSRRPHGPTDGVTWVRADVATGDGLAAAVSGVDAVVHAASAPNSGRYTRQVEVEGTAAVARAAAEAGVAHLMYVSIVGVDAVPIAYFESKVAAERPVREGVAPWTILRATQFHEFVEKMLLGARRFGVLLTDRRALAQPVDRSEVADRIARRLVAGPAKAVEEYGGPEVLEGGEAARRWLAARGERRPLAPIRIPGRAGRAIRAGALTTTARPTGRVTWGEYLAQRYGG